MSTFKNNNNLDSGSMAETELCRRKRRRGYPYLYNVDCLQSVEYILGYLYINISTKGPQCS